MRQFERVKRIEEEIALPVRSTKNSAGYDFFAIEDIDVLPMYENPKPALVRTGIKCQMNEGEFLMLCNRSSNPCKKALILANGVGVIDADYYGNEDNDGEIMFAFYNVSGKPVHISTGDKIGQGIFIQYGTVENDNAQGERTGGFGSTDGKSN